MTVKAFGAYAGDKPLEPMDISRRSVGPHDVGIEIAFCGVCHSDLHRCAPNGRGTLYPCVPGHEIVGRVSAVGAHVTSYKVGDLVGVGCMVDSCKRCADCSDGLGEYCDNMVGTYNGPTRRCAGSHAGRLLAADRGATSASCCASATPRSNWPPSRRCCAPASPPTRRCATGTSDPATRWASSASAAWATWASSSRTRWARTWWRSPPPSRSARPR